MKITRITKIWAVNSAKTHNVLNKPLNLIFQYGVLRKIFCTIVYKNYCLQ